MGETSDNLPGVPGVGPKTAAKWLSQYGDLDDPRRPRRRDQGQGRRRLREHLAQVLRNRQINKLVRDVPLDVAPADLDARASGTASEIHTLFDTLQFRVLRERLYATLSAAEPEADEGFDVDDGRLEPGEVGAWLEEHARGPPRHRASPARWGRGTGDITGVGAGVRRRRRRLPRPGRADRGRRAGAGRAGSPTPTAPKAMHDAKGPMLAFAARG